MGRKSRLQAETKLATLCRRMPVLRQAFIGRQTVIRHKGKITRARLPRGAISGFAMRSHFRICHDVSFPTSDAAANRDQCTGGSLRN